MSLISVIASLFSSLSCAKAQAAPEPIGVVNYGQPMHLTIGNDVDLHLKSQEEARSDFARITDAAKEAKATAWELYVKWMMIEPNEGQWDFSYYDARVETCDKQGLKWVPFIIAGPASATPMWFKDGSESVFSKCLEHGLETRTQSIFNPAMPARVETFIKAISEHFDHEKMQMVLLGISGDFGESIYTATGNKWTYIWDGEYHNHMGWWCAEDYAVADFQRAMKEKYEHIETLNAAWGTGFGGFQKIKTFIPDPNDQSRRARLDLTGWYKQSMTDYAETWFKITKKYFPDLPVTICTGGEAYPVLGADFSEQALMAAKYGYGIRVTNEASNYAWNFVITRWVGSVCRNLGTYFGYEPAGTVDLRAIAARIYNAVCSGADELFTYEREPKEPRKIVHKKYQPLLVKREPDVPVAVFLPKVANTLGLRILVAYKSASQFRDYSDFDFLDESLMDAGFLSRYKALVWIDGDITEKVTLEKIEQWVRDGGKLYCRTEPETVEGQLWKEKLSDLETATFVDKNATYASFFDTVARSEPELIPDGKADMVYSTKFKDGSTMVLNYSGKPVKIKGATIGDAEIKLF